MTPDKGGRKYTLKDKKDKNFYLQAISMTDPATGWIETLSWLETRTDLVAIQVELVWLTRCPFQRIEMIYIMEPYFTGRC